MRLVREMVEESIDVDDDDEQDNICLSASIAQYVEVKYYEDFLCSV